MENLIKLHASLEVLEHKLKNFHWHVVGFDHFESHEQLDNLIAKCRDSVDETAELIVMQGMDATCDFKTLSKLSIVKEMPGRRYDSLFIASILVDDFSDILNFTTSQNWNMLTQPVIDNLNGWILKARWQFESTLMDVENIE